MNAETTDNISVGKVLSLAIATLFRNFMSFAIIGLITFTPVLFVFFIGLFIFGPLAPDAIPDDQVKQSPSPAFIIVIGLVFILSVFAWGLCNGAVVDGTFRFLSKHGASIGGSIRRGINRARAIMGIMFALLLALGLIGVIIAVFSMMVAASLPVTLKTQVGYLSFIVLFIAAAFLMYTCFYVIVPVCVVEDAGVIGSFKRSIGLTKGFRWQILAMILLAGILQGLVNAAGTAITEAIQGHFGGVGAGMAIAGQLFLGLMIWMWQAILPAVAYFELRRVKEGIGIEHLASVLD